MDTYQAAMATLALVMGIGWASGVNLYLAVFVLGLAGAADSVVLPDGLAVLQEPVVIAAAGLMCLVEFLADKTPGVDSGWDGLHTLIRIPAGALLAAGAAGELAPLLEVAAGLLGGAVATISHLSKAASRLLINMSPEPFSNWAASVSEDLLVLGALWAMFNYPLVFVALLVLFLAVALWLLPKMWQLLKELYHRLRGALKGATPPARVAPAPPRLEGPW
ncbi:MAG: DUF4126 domain-containing protein [Porticoccaceae bacterium]